MIDEGELAGALIGALFVGAVYLLGGAEPLTAAFCSGGWILGNALRWFAQRRRP